MRDLLMNLEPIRQLLKANPDTTFTNEYPDNLDIRFSPMQKPDIQHEDQNYIHLWIYTISPLVQ